MNFDIREWMRIYNQVHKLGLQLTDSKRTYTDIGDYIPPALPLTRFEKMAIELEINILLERSNTYLDQCGFQRGKSLRNYDWKKNFYRVEKLYNDVCR